MKFTNFSLEILSALIDKIKGMCTSLMSLFGSITDQSQEYHSFNDVPLISGPWISLNDQLIVQL